MKKAEIDHNWQDILETFDNKLLLYSHNGDGVITYISSSAKYFFGLDADKIIGKNWVDIADWSQESIARSRELEKSMITQKDKSNFLKMHYTLNGQKKIIDVTGVTVFDDKNNTAMIKGMVIDVTEQETYNEKLYEETQVQLKEAKSDLEAALTASDIGIYEIDFCKDHMKYGLNTYRIYGLSPDALPRTPMDFAHNYIHPLDFPVMTKQWHKTLKEDKAQKWFAEYRVIRPDGKIIWIRDKCKINYNETKKPIKAIGSVVDITESKNTELEMSKALKQLNLATEYGHIGVLKYDCLTKKITANKQLKEMLNVTEQFLEKFDLDEWLTYVHPDHRQIHGQLIRKMLAGELKHTEDEFQVNHPTKNWVWIKAVRHTIEWTNQGKPQTIVCIHQDITAEKALEERYHQLFESSIDAFVQTTTEGVVTYCNQSLASMLGYNVEDIIGAHFNEYTPQKYHHWEKREILEKKLMRGQAVKAYRKEYIHKNGTIFPVEISAFPKLDPNGKAEYFWAIVRDVSELVSYEKKLRESEEKYRTIADFTYDWEYWISPDKSFNYVSPAVERITGYKVEDFQQNPNLIYDIIHPADLAKVKNHINTELQEDTPAHEYEFRLINKEGETCWINHVCQPVYDSNNNFIGRRASNRNITETKQLEEKEQLQREQLIQADKMSSLGVLVSGVAHEINNPNNLIMLNASFLNEIWMDTITILDEYAVSQKDFKLNKLPYQEMRSEFLSMLKEISDSSTRIKLIVESLKNFIRKEDSSLMLDVNINNVLKDAIIITGPLIRKRTDFFDVYYCNNLPRCQANPQQLEQVLINIISNACQALTAKTDNLTAKTYSSGQHVYIQIKDSGKGMTPEEKARIFDPFFTTKRDKGGTGLGLSISFSIIQALKGTIQIDSQPGKGTTVTVSLPIEANPNY